MATLRVATDELLATANTWHGLTAELSPTAVPIELSVSLQASAAAVNPVHAGAAAAGQAFAACIQITAAGKAAINCVTH
jgi:hypothetical protein